MCIFSIQPSQESLYNLLKTTLNATPLLKKYLFLPPDGKIAGWKILSRSGMRLLSANHIFQLALHFGDCVEFDIPKQMLCRQTKWCIMTCFYIKSMFWQLLFLAVCLIQSIYPSLASMRVNLIPLISTCPKIRPSLRRYSQKGVCGDFMSSQTFLQQRLPNTTTSRPPC